MSVMGVRVDLIAEDLLTVLNNIASSLERIADALEEEAE